MAKAIYEVFDEFVKASTKEEKKQILLKNNSHALRCVLRANYHPNIKFVFENIPEYKPDDSPPGMGYTNIDTEIDRIYLFEVGNPRVSPNLTMERRKQLLIQILESLEAPEAKLFASILMKKLNVKGLDKDLALEVFPQLLD